MPRETKQPIEIMPIGSNPTTGYPEVMCPNCKRHFYWRPQDKEFYCICGAVILVVK